MKMSVSKVDDNTALLQDSYKASLGSLDLFDRVINLKLTASNGESYVIRSDYETYFPKVMSSVSDAKLTEESYKTCYIRKCQYKPSIKVQYKRVSTSVPIVIDIFINNFFMLDKNGKMIKSFNNISNSLRTVELELGYFGQFESAMESMTKVYGKDTMFNPLSSKTDSRVTIDQLFDFNAENLKGHGITVITMSEVEYVQTDKLPPDMTVHIHGYVGNLYSDGSEKTAEDTPVEFENMQIIDYQNKILDLDTVIGKLFFKCVTKNWLNPVIYAQHKFSIEGITMAHPDDVTNTTIAGELTDEQASKYGVSVFMSNGAEEYAKEYDKINVLTNSNNEVYQAKLITISKASNALGKINAIKNALGLKRFCVTQIETTGDILVYLDTEIKSVKKMLTGTKLLENVYKEDAVSTYWDGKLPAVYNITTDDLCTITCPFFFFLNPFQEFEFKAAYALSGIVSYYANFTASEDKFYALWQTVSFATVEDINECTIVCTGSKE